MSTAAAAAIDEDEVDKSEEEDEEVEDGSLATEGELITVGTDEEEEGEHLKALQTGNDVSDTMSLWQSPFTDMFRPVVMAREFFEAPRDNEAELFGDNKDVIEFDATKSGVRLCGDCNPTPVVETLDGVIGGGGGWG